MEMTVIEKNKTNIFKGLISESLVNSLATSSIGTKENASNITATNKAMIQYVSTTALLILIWGNSKIDRVIPTNEVAEITSVGIITTNNYALLFKKINNFLSCELKNTIF